MREKDNMQTKDSKGNSLNTWVSLSFQTGALVSIALAVVGLILIGLGGLKGIEPIVPLSQLLQGILGLNATAIITLAILILLFTPVLQVLVAMVSLIIDGDKLYSGICIILLFILALSLVLAII